MTSEELMNELKNSSAEEISAIVLASSKALAKKLEEEGQIEDEYELELNILNVQILKVAIAQNPNWEWQLKNAIEIKK